MAKLFWLQPDNTIVEFPLKAEQNLIGRSSRCDVRIKHPGISAEHALIRVLPGSATVEDLNSTNGTRVNGRRVESHTLRHGDQIGVGRERLMYFAELDEASRFAQPASIEPFAQPAPGGETVNTDTASTAAGDIVGQPMPSPAMAPAVATAPVTTLNITLDLPATEAVAPARPAPQGRAGTETASVPAADGMPELDPALLASLPRGTVLTSSPAMPRTAAAAATGSATEAAAPPRQSVASIAPVPSPAAVAPAPSPAASSTPPVPRAHALVASVAVLSGPAVGKRYPLDQPSVTLGKEGKQVIELVRTSPTRWQLRQREGVTPAYVNGDALAGNRDLVAGDVIELIGVRLRFEVALAS